jgi:hypothetical protein
VSRLCLTGADVRDRNGQNGQTDHSPAALVAAQTRPEVVSFTWLLIGGVAAAWAQEVDIVAWQAVWVDIFRDTGFLANGCPAPRPEQPITLYRGCGLGGQFGLSWTTDADTACLFARLAGPPAAVYAHLAEPHELLLYAHIGTEGEGYDEYVLDPAYLNGDNVVEVDRL